MFFRPPKELRAHRNCLWPLSCSRCRSLCDPASRAGWNVRHIKDSADRIAKKTLCGG
jgi:hypothetical protein